MNIRAIVVDDEPLARDELRFMLGQCEDIEVVGEARNAPEAQKLCDEEQPDVAFLDLRMPGPDGVIILYPSRGIPESSNIKPTLFLVIPSFFCFMRESLPINSFLESATIQERSASSAVVSGDMS